MNDRGWGGRQGKMADSPGMILPWDQRHCTILLRRAGVGRRGEAHEQPSSGGIRSSAEEKEEGSEAAIVGVGCAEVARRDSGVIETETSFNDTACLISK